MTAGDGGVRVLFEDRWLLAVDKPAGVIVHGDGTGARTLTDDVRAHLVAAGEDEAARQLQAVQRIDRDTTGVVLFSKDKAVQATLDAALAGRAGGASGGVLASARPTGTDDRAAARPAGTDARAVTRADATDDRAARKRYLAVVRGEFPWRARTFGGPIGRDRHDARRMRVSRTGKVAETRVTRLAVAGGPAARRSLLLVELVTGRKHQIRVHLAHAGFPVLGDALYGVPADRGPHAPGLMLHAWEEMLVHPVTDETLDLVAPCPERIRSLFLDAELPAALVP